MADVMLDSNSPSQRQYILVLAPIFSKDLPWLSDFAIEMNNYSLYYYDEKSLFEAFFTN